MKLSIVSTLYQSEQYVEEFVKRCILTANKIFPNNYEILLVNDGSTDQSLKKAEKLLNNLKCLRLINLSRNFGHHNAILTGLSYAKGEYIFLIDCDLEEEPEVLIDFYKHMLKTKDDVVYGISANNSFKFRNLFRYFAYFIINYLNEIKIPKNICTVRLMNRNYLNNLLKYTEKEFSFGPLFHYIGFNQSGFYINKHFKGKSTYSFKLKVSLLLNCIINFSTKPLIILTTVGLLMSIISFLFLVILSLNYFINQTKVGWTSVIASIWLSTGFIMSSLGVLGLYISKVFKESKNRPISIVKEIKEWK